MVQVTDAEIMKEAKPSFYLKHILPILRKNRVVHFIGYGNRLSSDPIPFQLQVIAILWHFSLLLLHIVVYLGFIDLKGYCIFHVTFFFFLHPFLIVGFHVEAPVQM